MTAEFLYHAPCPSCGSKDNLAVYDDGHGYCFGCEYYTDDAAGGEGKAPSSRPHKGGRVADLIQETFVTALGKRNLTEETCAKFGYCVGTHGGEMVQIAPYLDASRRPVAQKIRTAGKAFTVKGDLSAAMPLWGQWLWRDAGRMVVVTEGEIDAMSVSQLQGNKWPVVSVPNGAAGAAKAVARATEWLTQFEDVVFLFDNDEPGRAAAEACAAILPPGRAKIATIDGYKDANEALVAGAGAKVIDAMWGAKSFRPDGIVQIEDLIEAAKEPVQEGLPWWLDSLTEATYGRRPGELYAFGAGTGVGKTDMLTQQAAFDIKTLGEKVGLVYLEMPPVELARRLAGKVAEKRFHLPRDEDAPQTEELAEALETLRGKVAIYDHCGETSWDVVKQRIRYMVQADGIRLIYLDHLTAMADPSDERASLETCMKEMAGLAQELGCIIHFVSHLATPDGKPHEEGARVMLRHFKGSRSIGFWTFFAFGMERNQQADNPEERRITTFRVLKDRFTGASVGQTIPLSYDTEQGMLFETTEYEFGGDDTDAAF